LKDENHVFDPRPAVAGGVPVGEAVAGRGGGRAAGQDLEQDQGVLQIAEVVAIPVAVQVRYFWGFRFMPRS
jgi:hypothetical protein